MGTQFNDVPPDMVYKAYRENLELTLPHVHELIEQVNDRSVVTADHNKLLNDISFLIPNRMYDHRPSLYTYELVDVPWHIYSSGPRREIVIDDETVKTDADDDVVRNGSVTSATPDPHHAT